MQDADACTYRLPTYVGDSLRRARINIFIFRLLLPEWGDPDHLPRQQLLPPGIHFTHSMPQWQGHWSLLCLGLP